MGGRDAERLARMVCAEGPRRYGCGMITLIRLGAVSSGVVLDLGLDLGAAVRFAGAIAFFLAPPLLGAGLEFDRPAVALRVDAVATLAVVFFAGAATVAAGLAAGRPATGAGGSTRRGGVPADTGAGVGAEGADVTGGVTAGAADDPADASAVAPGCCVPLVLPNRPAMNGLAMQS